jgi:hypothetical protein
MTGMLIPFGRQVAHKFPFLIKSAIITRSFVGMLRILADTPRLDPTPKPERDKIRNQLERGFIEIVGTLGGFVSLQFSQDVAAKFIELVNPRVRPAKLMDSLKRNTAIDAESLNLVEKTLKEIFNRSDLKPAQNSLFDRIYGKANLTEFAEKLNRPDLFRIVEGEGVGKLAKEVNQYFAHLNGMGTMVIMAGLMSGAYLSGTVLQDLNDNWFRGGLEVKIADWLAEKRGLNTSVTPQSDLKKQARGLTQTDAQGVWLSSSATSPSYSMPHSGYFSLPNNGASSGSASSAWQHPAYAYSPSLVGVPTYRGGMI